MISNAYKIPVAVAIVVPAVLSPWRVSSPTPAQSRFRKYSEICEHDFSKFKTSAVVAKRYDENLFIGG